MPWVSKSTVRETILFGEPFDERRYVGGFGWIGVVFMYKISVSRRKEVSRDEGMRSMRVDGYFRLFCFGGGGCC